MNIFDKMFAKRLVIDKGDQRPVINLAMNRFRRGLLNETARYIDFMTIKDGKNEYLKVKLGTFKGEDPIISNPREIEEFLPDKERFYSMQQVVYFRIIRK